MTDTDQGRNNVNDSTTDAASVRRLTRSKRHRMVAGVAGGIGEHLGIDPILVRLAFVLLSFAGGVGVVLYVAAWVLVPEDGAPTSPAESALRGRAGASWISIALLVVGVLLLLSVWDNTPAMVWGLGFIVAGVLLYRSEASPPSPVRPPAPAPAHPGPTTAPLPADTAAAPPEPRSDLGRMTIAVALLVLGGAAMLDNAGALELDAGDYPALGLAIVGAGLLAGALWGRSRGLILVGIALLPFAFAGTLADVPFRGGVGDRTFAPLSVDEVPARYRIGAGELTIDLTDLRWPDEPVEVEASVAFGVLQVVVPEGVSVSVDAHAGAGELIVLERRQDGLDVDLSESVRSPTDEAHLQLDARTSFGEIRIERAETELEQEEETP